MKLSLISIPVFILFLFFVSVPSSVAQPATLSMQEAENLALESDPMLKSIAERKRAIEESAIADAQLPDPIIRLGAVNVPVDSFNRNQEAMTQIQFGVSQRFPRGQSLRIKGEHGSAMASVEQQRQQARFSQTLKEVRDAWLDVYYWQQAIEILNEQQQALAELLDVIQSHYGEGKGQQQDVLRAELELGLLEDKILSAHSNHENAISNLSMWVGQRNMHLKLSSLMPSFPALLPLEQLKQELSSHPIIGIHEAEIMVSKSGVSLARQAYKPAWGVDLGYGSRASNPIGVDRSDFVSLMVNVDVPLFTKKRQDRRLSAAKHKQAAARLSRDEKKRQLEKMLDEAWSDYKRSDQRLELYNTKIINSSTDTYKVTLNAYQNEVADFALLMRARLLNFDTRLQSLRLSVENSKAKVRLLYLQGEK